MMILSNILIGIVALLHIYFLVLEMFLWTKPYGLKTFRMSSEKAATTKSLAQNQGLYNGFLAAGLVFSILSPDPGIGDAFKIFFLNCVIIAGIYGARTVGKSIFYFQALPAIFALISLKLV